MSDRDDPIEHARAKWRHRGQGRPRFAQEPTPGRESVWDYPRPPRLAPDSRAVLVTAAGVTLAETRRAIRVLETGSPPSFYLPPEDVRIEMLVREPGTSSICEWKGVAEYFAVHAAGQVIPHAAWRYPKPFEAYQAIAGYYSFYPRQLACYVDGERVRPQPGLFYGGWLTSEIVGPVKGEPGSEHW